MKKKTSFKVLRRKFGIWTGLSLFLKFSIKKNIQVKLPGIAHPFFLRNIFADNYVFYEVFVKNGYHIRFKTRVKVIVDAGANIGLFTIQMKALYPDARIIAIEPDNDNFEFLQKNLMPYRDIVLENAGVWSKDTMLDIHDKFPAGKCALQTSENHLDGKILGISIKSLMEKHALKRIDIFKIDIETSEKELFMENYQEWLPRVKVIIIELHDHLREGCSKAFFEAINKTFVKYSYSIRGSSTIIISHNIP